MHCSCVQVVPNPELKNLQGTPFVTKDGKFIIIMADDKLHVYEVRSKHVWMLLETHISLVSYC